MSLFRDMLINKTGDKPVDMWIKVKDLSFLKYRKVFKTSLLNLYNGLRSMCLNRVIVARNKGFYGEDIASTLLTAHNFVIIERNYNTKVGEIDIIATKKGIIHFIEVKTTYGRYNPAENFHKTKLKRFMRTVRLYCYFNKIKESQIQIDLALVDLQNRRFSLVQNANLYFH